MEGDRDDTTLRQRLLQQGPPVEDLTRRIGADAAGGLWALRYRVRRSAA